MTHIILSTRWLSDREREISQGRLAKEVGIDDEPDEKTTPPPWMHDEKVKDGIKAVLDLDRALEEERRLCMERGLLQEFFRNEYIATTIALQNTSK